MTDQPPATHDEYMTFLRNFITCSVFSPPAEEVAKAHAALTRLQSAVSETAVLDNAITYDDIRRQIAHIERNGISLKKFGGDNVDEGRCRELCAMYLREFIATNEIGKRLRDFDLATRKA